MSSIRLTMRPEREGKLYATYCPELNLRAHGETSALASDRLWRSIWVFLRACHDKGTLVKVLKERGALHEDPNSDQTIQIPFSDSLFSPSRSEMH